MNKHKTISVGYELMLSWFEAQYVIHWVNFTHINIMNHKLNKPALIALRALPKINAWKVSAR